MPLIGVAVNPEPLHAFAVIAEIIGFGLNVIGTAADGVKVAQLPAEVETV